MKLNITIFSIGFALACLSCSHSAKDNGLSHDHNHHDKEEIAQDLNEHIESEEHGHEQEHSETPSGNEIILEHAMAHRFGVHMQHLEPREFNEIIKVSGQIMSAPGDQGIASAQSAGIISISNGIVEGKNIGAGASIAYISAQKMAGGDSNASAKANLDAAKRELDRITPLHADGIVSTKDFNVAKQAYELALAAYSGNANGSTVSSPISGIITQILVQHGQFVDAGQPIAVISKNTRLTLRADLPEKYYYHIPTIKTANFRPSYSDSIICLDSLNSKIVTSSATPAQAGYIPIYFSFDNDGSAIPGTFAEIYLIGAARPNTIVVPIDAITEQQGKYYAYVQIDADCYEKRLVSLGKSNGNEVEIRSGLHAGDNVVAHGAIIVKLAESSGVIPEGHSHNH